MTLHNTLGSDPKNVRILITDQANPAENGIYVRSSLTGYISRSSDAINSTQFTSNKTVTILNGDVNAGSTFAYNGSTEPTIGTDSIEFVLKSSSVIGNGSISESKLDSALGSKINNKVDKYSETIVCDGTNPTQVVHGLNTTDVGVHVYNQGSHDIVDIDIIDIDTVTIRASSGTYRVVIFG